MTRRPGAARAALCLVALTALDCSRAAPRPTPEPAASATLPSTTAPAASAAGPLRGMPEDEIVRRKERGRAVYARWHCASCHSSATALPSMKVKALVRLGERYDVDSLDAWIHAPRKPMPTYPIRDDDRRSLAVFLLTTEESER